MHLGQLSLKYIQRRTHFLYGVNWCFMEDFFFFFKWREMSYGFIHLGNVCFGRFL